MRKNGTVKGKEENQKSRVNVKKDGKKADDL